MKKLILCCSFLLVALTLQASELTGYTVEKLKSVLVEDFRPYPRYGDKVWMGVPDSVRQPYIANAEKYIGCTWQSLPISLFMEFRTIGDRNRFQNVYFAKRTQLQALAMAELLEGKGRFLLPLFDGLLSVCEETWWGLPAHYSHKFPLVEDQHVALYVAQTAGDVAMIQYVYKNAIDSLMPDLNKRITAELKRRMLEPCRQKNFGWKTNTSNWNPWITSMWIATSLLAEENMTLRAHDIHGALQAMEYYYSHYRNDGGCDEGPGYWASSCGSFFNCNFLLYKASNGVIDFSKDEKFRRMGEFICGIYMGRDNRFANFADASPKTNLPPGMLFEYGKFIGSEQLMEFGALKAHEVVRQGGLISAGKGSSYNGFLYILSDIKELWNHRQRQPFTAQSYFDVLQVFIARQKAGTDAGLAIAAKGGHNDESHNHNDIGNFIVFADGQQLIIDPGSMTYTAKTFTKERYTSSWVPNSNYHNTPIINGIIQKEGRRYEARQVRPDIGKNRASFTLDVAGAYPEEAAVDSWVRTITMDRKKKAVTVLEKYCLKQYNAPSEIALMTAARISTPRPGQLLLEQHGKRYLLSFDAAQLSVSIDQAPDTEEPINKQWGTVWRIKLRILSTDLSGKVAYSLKEMESL